ncbi:nitroreductase [Gluconacetobacter johannae DSM 13595]|uniref:NADPH-dependent oxidoreductase n=1 Tax=Gluconacetobacter johannae TaxID=112140 RepID=A0A7W4J5K6_9PROT|nr:nitroreductase family protein [Gluconacetobacter johannae]MBB2175074.1 NADPH-dependent oxidoreductase [Gluconacetobacter johannae]GBQ87086.1 nitroreductase [Gluconacetobacter johannae DSM 13595]
MTDDVIAGLWTARYRTAPPDGVPSGDDVLRHLLSHRSVRAYRPDPLPDGALEAAVAAAQSASTSSNLQAWSVVAVEDPARRTRLAALAGGQAHIVQAPLFLAWLVDLSRLSRLGAARAHATDGLDYLETFVVGVVDAALAAQNAAATFESQGLGIVYIGGLRNHPEQVARELELPGRTMAVFGMCVGHPDSDRPASIKPRLPQSVVLHRERYGMADEAAGIAAYDQSDAAFQREQGLAPRAWSDAMVRRVAGPESLSGRDRLRDALAALGFPLR